VGNLKGSDISDFKEIFVEKSSFLVKVVRGNR